MEAEIPGLGKIHFINFQTSRIGGAVEMIKRNQLCKRMKQLYATGGGANKYKDLFQNELGVEFIQHDELDTIVHGMVFLMRNVENECFSFDYKKETETKADDNNATYSKNNTNDDNVANNSKNDKTDNRNNDEEKNENKNSFKKNSTSKEDDECDYNKFKMRNKIYRQFNSHEEDLFPFLICNIGTGVSIVKVDAIDKITRISGTALGGGTFLGLCRLLTRAREFDDALDLAETGNSRNVNMLVKDIYSSDIRNFKLAGDLTASFFAKNIATQKGEDLREDVSDNDLCAALCVMVAQNITQIAHLNARLHGISRVFFTGNFLRHNPIAFSTIMDNMNRWTQLDGVELETLFFKHEGYFGAMGCFLKTLEEEEAEMPEDERKLSKIDLE
eukprot:Awhi_evm1s3414